MAQSSYTVDNAAGAVVRSKINDINAAMQSQNSGTTAPTDTRGGMMWIDTSTTPPTLKIRTLADDAWVTLGTLDGSTYTADANALPANLTSLAGLTLAANKMLYATAANTLALADLTAAGRTFLAATTKAAQRTALELGSANKDLADITFSEGDLLYHDGSNLVNLGKGTAGQKLAMNSGATAPEWVEDYVDAWMNAKWVDKTSVRSANTEYTNGNSFPLEVAIRGSDGNEKAEVSADGGTTWVDVGGNGATGFNSFSFTVPPGGIYKYAGTPTSWSERDG